MIKFNGKDVVEVLQDGSLKILNRDAIDYPEVKLEIGIRHLELAGEGVPLFAMYKLWSDVEPYLVVRKCGKKSLLVRKMKCTMDPDFKPEFIRGGFSYVCLNNAGQKWIIEPDPDGEELMIRLSKSGEWGCRGRRFYLSEKPYRYYDINF